MLRLVAWLGGLAFVASLGYFVYFYLVVLATPAPPGSPAASAALFDLALFTLFALHHSVMARSGAKAWLTRRVPPAAERTLYVWVASVLFLAVCLLWQPLPGGIYVVEGLAAWPLRAVQLAGVILTFRAAGVIDPLELAGIRQAAGDERPVAFKVIGPYRWVRHPIYLGWILIVFGTPAMTASRLLFAAVSSLYLVVAIPLEERGLVAAFGERYRAYQGSVRSRLLPGLW